MAKKMRVSAASLLTIAAVAISEPAVAQAVGNWHVTGEVSGRSFAVDCHFVPQGSGFGGACIDAATGDSNVKAGKSHRLTMGVTHGDQIWWTYQTTVLFMGVDIAYVGTLAKDRLSGTITAGGRKGNFTALRTL